jgi:hypothetical protein
VRLGVARALVGIVVAQFFLAVGRVVTVEFRKWLEVRLAPWRASAEAAD